MSDNDPDKSPVVAEPREKADAEQVNDLIRGAINEAAGCGLFDSLMMSHNTRHMLWAGQDETGLLPKLKGRAPRLGGQRRVFSWEGAPDTRLPYVDEVIEEERLIGESVWHRGEVRMGPRELEDGDGTGDEEKAASWQEALNFWLDVYRREFGYQVGLFRTCVSEYGYALAHVGCRRQVRTAKEKVTMAQVLEVVVKQATDAYLGDQGGGEVAPLTPEEAAAIGNQAQMSVNMMVMMEGDDALRTLLMTIDPRMPKSEARLAAKELRANAAKAEISKIWEASATYYVPQDDGYMPFVEALVPFINCIHGMDLTGDGKTSWFTIPRRMCEAEARGRAATENWGDDFLEEFLQKGNEFLISSQSWNSQVPTWAASGCGVGLEVNSTQEQEFFEALYSWRILVDKNGFPMVYHTLTHASINDKVGFHECSGLATLPLHAESRERVLYAIQSRGVPEIAVAGQNLMKSLFDAEGARSQLGSKPPLLRDVKEHVDIEPGQQMYKPRNGEGSAFMSVPQPDQGSYKLIELTRQFLDRRFFRDATTPPEMRQMYLESIAMNAADTIRELVRLIWKVMQGNVDELKVGRIAGREVNLEITRDDMQGEVDVTVDYSVESMNPDASDKLMEFGTQLIQMGAENVDVNELVNMIVRTRNPGLARRILMPRDVAAEKTAQDQANRISQMWSGSQMRYPDRQSGVPRRMQVMEAWLADPENTVKLQQSPRFAEQMQAEYDYLKNQSVQYSENPARGRAVVPKEAQAA